MTEEIQEPRSQQVDAAIAEYLGAAKQGAPPDQTVFLAQHAEIASELKDFLTDYRRFDGAVQHIAEAASTDGGMNSTGRGATVVRLPLESPQPFGNFELIEEIARGGMGVVYKARQLTPQRIVALKMILAGQFASQADVDRFYAEAHAAAALDHPQIVPIFEVGQHDGQRYFTMAFVEGQSLAQRLAAGPLPPREAATMIRDVALAVDYAHQHGVIHRDLKPGNILVDADGRARVTDFGLAKRQADESGLTQTGEILGTPSFMSPEQVGGNPSDVGPASDVYSLGASLYALIVGRPPFQAANMVDTLNQVKDQDPVAPRTLAPTIPRDLETIALKCLEKSPARRYPTAQGLADELTRFLEGRPIQARPVGRAEQAWRWCKRSPAVAMLIFGIVSVLIGGIAASTYFAISASREAKAAKLALEDAHLQRKTAEGVNDFFSQEVFFLAAPNPQKRDEIRLVDALDIAAAKIEDRFPNDPDLRFVLHDRLGLIYWGAGLGNKKAEEQFAKAVKLCEVQHGTLDPQTLRMRSYLAAVMDPSDAKCRELLEQTLADQTKILGPNHVDTLYTATKLGSMLQSSQDPKDLETLEDVYKRSLAALGPKHSTTLEAQSQFSWALRWRGKFEQALEYAKPAALGLREVKGPDDVHTMSASYNYAACLQQMGRKEEAAVELNNLLEARTRVFGLGNSNTMWALWRLVGILHGLDRTPEAAELLNKCAVQIDDGHTTDFTILASGYADIGDNESAIKWTRKSVEMKPNDAQFHGVAARTRLTAGDVEGYRKCCAELWKQFETATDRKSSFWSIWTCCLAPDALDDLGPPIARARKMVAIADSGGYETALGILLFRAKQYDEADQVLTNSIDAFGKNWQSDWMAICSQISLAMTKRKLGREAEAQQVLASIREPMIAVLTATPSWDRRRTINIFYDEAVSLIGKPAESASKLPK